MKVQLKMNWKIVLYILNIYEGRMTSVLNRLTTRTFEVRFPQGSKFQPDFLNLEKKLAYEITLLSLCVCLCTPP
jgi:hypothetical protein